MQRDAPTSLYVQIASALRHDIVAGRYEPTGRLPSEEELRGRFQVSRVTVRLALAELEREGLIDRRKAKGTFTRGKEVRHSLDILRSFHETLRAQGIDASILFLNVKTEPIGSDDGLDLRVTRLHVADGKTIALGSSKVPSILAQQDWSAVGEQPLYSILEEALGCAVERADFRVGLGFVDEDIAEAIGTKVSQPILRLRRRSFVAGGDCVDDTNFYIRSDRYEFTVTSRY